MRLPWIGKRTRAGQVASDGSPLPQPPSIGLIYDTLVDKTKVMEARLCAADARAGILIGLTTAAFSLVATEGGSSSSLFLRQAFATPIAIGLLAAAFAFLLSSFITEEPRDFPEPTVFIALANERPERVKELSLQALGVTLEFNRAILRKKFSRIFLAEVMLATFVVCVVVFEGVDLAPRVAPVLTGLWAGVPYVGPEHVLTPVPSLGATHVP